MDVPRLDTREILHLLQLLRRRRQRPVRSVHLCLSRLRLPRRLDGVERVCAIWIHAVQLAEETQLAVRALPCQLPRRYRLRKNDAAFLTGGLLGIFIWNLYA